MTEDERENLIREEYKAMLMAISPTEKKEHADKMAELINGRSPEMQERVNNLAPWED